MALGATASRAAQLSALGLGLAIFVWMMMSCICGCFDGYALLGAVPGACLAWTAMIQNISSRLMARSGFALVTIVTTFLLLKVIVDILWTGHGPMFAQPLVVEHWIYWQEYSTWKL